MAQAITLSNEAAGIVRQASQSRESETMRKGATTMKQVWKAKLSGIVGPLVWLMLWIAFSAFVLDKYAVPLLDYVS